MPDNKIITLENLTEFKSKCDETYSGSGGTKLYKHALVLKNTSIPSVNGRTYIIAPSKDGITTINELRTLLISYNCVNPILSTQIQMDGGGNIKLYSIYNGNITVYNDSYDSVSDTVTEL